jgi:phosphatidylglycerophosphatase A
MADRRTPRTIQTHVLKALASALGLGFAPIAPGTAGSVLGVAIFVGIAMACSAAHQTVALALATALVCTASVPLGHWAEHHWSTKDPRYFVLDEVAGMLLTVLLFRTGSMWLTALWTFMAFRAFDIVKPMPARRLEKLPGGWGALIDDLVAAVYAAGSLHVLALLFPSVVGAVAR